MSDSEVATKRRGGRQARRELRAAPLPAEARPVKPGMEGGLYRPLTDTDIERIDRAALDMLDQVGFSDAIPSCVELVTAAGGSVTPEGRLLFPRALVKNALATAARNFTLCARDPAHVQANDAAR